MDGSTAPMLPGQAAEADAGLADEQTRDRLIFRCLLDEVYLLLDYVSGQSNRTVDALKSIRIPSADPKQPPVAGEADEVIAHVGTLRYPPDPGYPIVSARNAAFLLTVKDRLNLIAWPANGATIAYTTMVAASGEQLAPAGARSARVPLAESAYPGLVVPARRLRMTIKVCLNLLLGFVVLTALISGTTFFGKSLLQRIEQLNRSRAELSAQIKTAESPAERDRDSTVRHLGPPLGDVIYRLCDLRQVDAWLTQAGRVNLPSVSAADGRAPQPIDFFTSHVQQDICDAASDLKRKIDLAYADLSRFEHRFPDAPKAASEQWLAIVLATVANFVLPACFSLLGAGVSLARMLSERVRQFTLAPRDNLLWYVRLTLGLAAGASIGLFLSPSDAPIQGGGGLTGTLSLSASALAFLAGYAIDRLFGLLDSLVERVFVVSPVNRSGALPPPASAPAPPSTAVPVPVTIPAPVPATEAR